MRKRSGGRVILPIDGEKAAPLNESATGDAAPNVDVPLISLPVGVLSLPVAFCHCRALTASLPSE